VAALRAGVAVGPQGSCDSSATLAAGHVVLAPVESDELLCLDLASGELVWKRQIEGLLYVGCIHDATVLAVGAEGLSAWNLSSGKPMWGELSVALPDGARPAGRGVRRGHFYYLPATTSEVLRIDLADGRVVERMKTTSAPGNLVALPGLLISQSVHAVEAFGTSPAITKPRPAVAP
jgi:outer membrane protein assembly factor BamB